MIRSQSSRPSMQPGPSPIASRSGIGTASVAHSDAHSPLQHSLRANHPSRDAHTTRRPTAGDRRDRDAGKADASKSPLPRSTFRLDIQHVINVEGGGMTSEDLAQVRPLAATAVVVVAIHGPSGNV